MDLDYRALGNAGLWCVGRLQGDADRHRVLDGLAGNDPELAKRLAATVQRLAPQWFLVRDAHLPGLGLVQPRWAMSWLRGPMTREELRRARGQVSPERALGVPPRAQEPPDGVRASDPLKAWA